MICCKCRKTIGEGAVPILNGKLREDAASCMNCFVQLMQKANVLVKKQ